MPSANYNKVNSFICMFSITDAKSVAPSKAKHTVLCKSLRHPVKMSLISKIHDIATQPRKKELQ